MGGRVWPVGVGALAISVACSRFGATENVVDAGGDAPPEAGAAPDADVDVGVVQQTLPVGCLAGNDDDRPCKAPCADGKPCTRCRELLDRYADVRTGYYELRGAAGELLEVYCDMTTAGGGWVLVGRSEQAAAADTSFGWLQAEGDVFDDETSSYSLDVRRLGFAPIEMLYGSRLEKKAWGANVYRLSLPVAFFGPQSKTGEFDVAGAAVAVAGTCPSNGDFQRYIGFTDAEHHFHFRDVEGEGQFGLEPTGWDVNHQSGCSRAGGFEQGQAGMIFVR